MNISVKFPYLKYRVRSNIAFAEMLAFDRIPVFIENVGFQFELNGQIGQCFIRFVLVYFKSSLVVWNSRRAQQVRKI